MKRLFVSQRQWLIGAVSSVRARSVLVALLIFVAHSSEAQRVEPTHGRDPSRGPHRAPDVLRVRPFITDDARVVGDGLAQVEIWGRSDRESTQLWALGAMGPTPWLELTVGGVVGVERGEAAEEDPTPGHLTYALPLLQAKLLARPYVAGRGPGLALVAGTFLPGGRGFLKLPGYGTFGYAAMTQALAAGWQASSRTPDPPILHVNVGVNRLWVGAGPDLTVATWGVGVQAPLAVLASATGRVAGPVPGLHVVAEVFSGDPYVPGSGTAWQAGVRQFVSTRVQVDATAGRGFGGNQPIAPWWSAGVRIVFD